MKADRLLWLFLGGFMVVLTWDQMGAYTVAGTRVAYWLNAASLGFWCFAIQVHLVLAMIESAERAVRRR